MKIPLLNGIYTTAVGDFRVSYPRNLVPVPVTNGISEGYLRPADGIIGYGDGPGVDRGGINWRDQCYRVMGTKLCLIASDGTLTQIAEVPGVGQVQMDYSFDRLMIISDGVVHYWTGTVLQTVTDPDVGYIIDGCWVDGYFFLTDGEFLIVTELSDPTSVNPLKYGSAEADPDPIKALLKLKNEPYALNRYTIEVFDNAGGENFPFSRVEGAQIQRGVIGTNACCLYGGAIAFVGGGRNESTSVWIGANGQAQRIATQEVDLILAGLTTAEQSEIQLETRAENGHEFLYMHLPDRTLVYDLSATKALQQPVWHVRATSLAGVAKYRARNHVRCYDKWLVGDPLSAKHGYLTDAVSSHWGVRTGWELMTAIIYNEGRGAIIHELELVSLTGRVDSGSVIWTSYSVDGELWSAEKSRPVGKLGERNRRITWHQQGLIRPWRIQRFRGDSDAHISITRLKAQIKALYA